MILILPREVTGMEMASGGSEGVKSEPMLREEVIARICGEDNIERSEKHNYATKIESK